jgi:hypothetical protein
VYPQTPAGRYLLQEALPGAPYPALDDGLLDSLLVLNDLQQGVAGTGAGIAGGAGVAGVYLAHLCHRQVDWSIRHHSATIVEGWLTTVSAVLRDISAATGYRFRTGS